MTFPLWDFGCVAELGCFLYRTSSFTYIMWKVGNLFAYSTFHVNHSLVCSKPCLKGTLQQRGGAVELSRAIHQQEYMF